MQGSGCRVQGSEFAVQGSGFRVQGSGCSVQGLAPVGGEGAGFRVYCQCLGSRVQPQDAVTGGAGTGVPRS